VLDEAVADRAARAGHEVQTPAGTPTSRISCTNCQAIAGASLDGFKTTVLPVTIAAVGHPGQIASGKFHGGITTPTPSGM
jgi:hypothetical protein